MWTWTGVLFRRIGTLLLTALLGGILGATLVRFAPGFGVDERELDTRLHQDSIQALRRSHSEERNVLQFYASYLAGAARGNLGVSHSFGRPVTQLFAERLPVTLRTVALGLAGGWMLGLLLALPVVRLRGWSFDFFASSTSGVFLCLPTAVVAILFLYFRGPVALAICVVVFPRVFRYARNILVQTYALPHVLTASAKGLSTLRILLWHIFPVAAPQILALSGVTVSIALGAAIPIEVICDSPGIGQLAWQAALSRDLPVLVNMTLFVTLVTLTANSAADLATKAFETHPV
jgi:peptide/nickel transport system permease protein